MRDKCRRLKDKILGTFVDEIRESTFYHVDFKSTIDRLLIQLGERKIGQILCYGLGSFHDGIDVISKYQLALLILLHELLLDRGSPLNSIIEIYDPSFEQLDKDTLSAFTQPQFSLIPINENCARQLEDIERNTCVLVYMPHLDKHFYNNLLGVNWKLPNLSQLVILGNSFTEMIEKEMSSSQSKLHFLNLLVNNFELEKKNAHKRKGKMKNGIDQETPNALVEIPLDDGSFRHHDVFNSFAFHFISETWLALESSKIEKSSLPDWTCSTSTTQDD